MKIHVFETAEKAGRAAAAMFAAQLQRKPESVFGFATGSTPIPLYDQLCDWYAEGLLDFSGAVSFNLDEYRGVEASNPCSYVYFMREHLFDRVNFRSSCLPDGTAADPDAECAAYEKAIAAAGGIDLQLLGIGGNGHIGFNEPCDEFIQDTHVVPLTAETIAANSRFFDSPDQVPRSAVTMGIGTIMRAREIVLVATGANKASAVRSMVEGPVAPQCPASILRDHQAVTVFLDRDAASLLKK